MVAFKRLFQTERYSPTGHAGQDVRKGDAGLSATHKQSAPHIQENHAPSAHAKVAQPANGLSDVDRHFERIERQLEELHENMQKRPVSRAQTPARSSSRQATRNRRHVDLLEAVFSASQRQQAAEPSDSPSPVSPYNEDVAERNMTRFLQQPPRKRNLYTRFMSALYQDDVTDKNAAKNKDDARPRSRSTTLRSQNASSGSSKLNAKSHKRNNSGLSDMGVKDSRPAELSPPATSRPRSRTRGDETITSTRETQPHRAPHLRPQRSAPNLATEKTNVPQRNPELNTTGHLSVPPAYKQGDAWRNAPIPDSPTLPTPMGHEKSVNENEPVREPPSTTEQRAPSPFCNYSLPKRPAAAPRTSSKKNIRDLSINTELATQGKSAKPSHRAIQPPTPSSNDMKYNPSIAEVMNSPLPSGTPTSISPLPSSNSKVVEIMDMFKRAYTSTQDMSPHPTFETLQDAIVREVNSHEAFQRLPAPETGPPFTPSPSQKSFDENANPPKTSKISSSGPNKNGNGPGKESQFSKLIKPGSSKKSRKGFEPRRSISASIPSKVLGRVSVSSSRRRHTDAPAPSPGFFDTTDPVPERVHQMPGKLCMDVRPRSQTTSAPKKGSASLSNTLDHAQSIGTLSSHGSSTTPSVYYMRAQTSPSSDGQTSISVDDTDDDVLHLPSPTMTGSRQIRGIDKDNAFQLVNWQQSAQQNMAIKGSTTVTETSLSPRSSTSGQWARPMETF